MFFCFYFFLCLQARYFFASVSRDYFVRSHLYNKKCKRENHDVTELVSIQIYVEGILVSGPSSTVKSNIVLSPWHVSEY